MDLYKYSNSDVSNTVNLIFVIILHPRLANMTALYWSFLTYRKHFKVNVGLVTKKKTNLVNVFGFGSLCTHLASSLPHVHCNYFLVSHCFSVTVNMHPAALC